MTEWLETDGLGGFAMGTADAIRTRRYHALLLAATEPPDRRMVLVADHEAFVVTPAGRFALTSHRYRGEVIHPDGTTRITRFDHEPWPRWEWTLPDGARVACELVVARGAPRTALRWTRLAGTVTALDVQPLLAPRDYHATHHENPAFRFAADVRGEVVTWRPYDGVPAIRVAANALYQHAPDWYRSFWLRDEAERGLDCQEDLAAPGVFTFDLAAGPAVMVLAADELTGDPAQTATRMFDGERARRARFASPLARAADAYVVARGAGQTIIAGYPWFSDWGRDTFISLRGLCLSPGSDRRDDARAILLAWAGVVDGGMLPNRFDEHDARPEYNSVDAALWYVVAAAAYLEGKTSAGDRERLEAAIAAIVDGHLAGTRHGIRVDRDGLLAAGVPGLQLTWMDAKVGDHVVTPRIGKPVEIQALWINALRIAGRTADAERATAAFRARFWDPARRQLYDVVDVDHEPGRIDPSTRPNQIFAIGGLPHALLDGDIARAVVDTAFRELWTPAGPHSLAPGDPRYAKCYAGGPAERDRCYHNGPVWPWLAGAFVEAWLRVRGNTAEARREAQRQFVAPLHDRLAIAGLGHLSEICDGDPPHRPCGCPFQAWSVAELLRLDALA
ncbi:MAG TPA: amylo-alpha-1,6-glucosidase [Kofleriaceae bacterium]|nr:amylo-alpha-1,6-glucosidase [Kofleriaceae bacterium]